MTTHTVPVADSIRDLVRDQSADYRLIPCRTCDGAGRLHERRRLWRRREFGYEWLEDEVDAGPCPNPDCKDGSELIEAEPITIEDLEMEDLEQ